MHLFHSLRLPYSIITIYFRPIIYSFHILCTVVPHIFCPIINENDTVATDEISVGDNDTLAAIVSVNVGAELLVLLTDINGLYTSDPRSDKEAKLIPVVEEINEEIKKSRKEKMEELE